MHEVQPHKYCVTKWFIPIRTLALFPAALRFYQIPFKHILQNVHNRAYRYFFWVVSITDALYWLYLSFRSVLYMMLVQQLWFSRYGFGHERYIGYNSYETTYSWVVKATIAANNSRIVSFGMMALWTNRNVLRTGHKLRLCQKALICINPRWQPLAGLEL